MCGFVVLIMTLAMMMLQCLSFTSDYFTRLETVTLNTLTLKHGTHTTH